VLIYHVPSPIQSWGIVYHLMAYTSIFWAKICDRGPAFGPLWHCRQQFPTAVPNLGLNLPAFLNSGYYASVYDPMDLDDVSLIDFSALEIYWTPSPLSGSTSPRPSDEGCDG